MLQNCHCVIEKGSKGKSWTPSGNFSTLVNIYSLLSERAFHFLCSTNWPIPAEIIKKSGRRLTPLGYTGVCRPQLQRGGSDLVNTEIICEPYKHFEGFELAHRPWFIHIFSSSQPYYVCKSTAIQWNKTAVEDSSWPLNSLTEASVKTISGSKFNYRLQIRKRLDAIIKSLGKTRWRDEEPEVTVNAMQLWEPISIKQETMRWRISTGSECENVCLAKLWLSSPSLQIM